MIILRIGLMFFLALVGTFMSCAPVHHDAYLFPVYEGGKSKVLRRDCCGGAGPKEVLTIKGPSKTKYVVRMRWFDKSIEGRIAVYIPKGVKVDLEAQSIRIKFEGESEQFEYPIKIVNETALVYLNPKCLNVIGNAMGADYQWKTFPKQFEGKGKKGTIIWTDIFLSEAPSGKFRLFVPEITVEGEPFIPLPIDFETKEPDTYIYPLNC
jgi:hypothetical protein